MINVLLIDDNYDDAELILTTVLHNKDLSLVIDYVKNLEEAKKTLNQKDFDVILLDLCLPGDSKTQTLSALLAIAEDIPVIALVGDDTSDAQIAIQEGAQDYIEKSLISTAMLERAIRNVLERQSIMNLLMDHQTLQRISESAAQTGGWLYDLSRKSFDITKGLLDVFNLNKAETNPISNYPIKNLLKIIDKKTRRDLFNLFKKSIDKGTKINYEFLLASGEGREKWIRVIGEPISRKKIRVKVIGCVLDITKEKSIQKKLEQKATTDRLTGLYNRRGFFAYEQEHRVIAKRNEQMMFLLYADIDDLEQIYESLGVVTGDKLICDFSEILKKSFRESDLCARIGDDAFVVLGELKGVAKKERLVARLINHLDDYNKKTEAKISFSYGLELFNPKLTRDMYGIINKAEKEMQLNKEELFHMK